LMIIYTFTKNIQVFKGLTQKSVLQSVYIYGVSFNNSLG
jgi:hypothetical protein